MHTLSVAVFMEGERMLQRNQEVEGRKRICFEKISDDEREEKKITVKIEIMSSVKHTRKTSKKWLRKNR